MVTATRESAANRASRNRRENLLRFVRQSYGSDEKSARADFRSELKEKLMSVPALRREAATNRASISKSLSQKTALPLSAEKAALIETLFSLEPEYLSRERAKKAPVYVLLQCKAHTAEKLCAHIAKVDIVDEVAVIIGDSDLFVRLYGTREEIKFFLLEDIFDIARKVAKAEPTIASGSEIIDRTKTYMSFEDSYFLRYHPKRNSDFHENKQIPRLK